jgi:hypothetical protein
VLRRPRCPGWTQLARQPPHARGKVGVQSAQRPCRTRQLAARGKVTAAATAAAIRRALAERKP